MLQCSFVFDADNGTILCMLYDMRRDIIITAGVGGVKVRKFIDRTFSIGGNFQFWPNDNSCFVTVCRINYCFFFSKKFSVAHGYV